MAQPSPVSPLRARLSETLERFIHIEASSGIVLLAAAIVALFWANSPWNSSYEGLWHTPVSFSIGAYSYSQTLHFLINDGLMAVFFLLVGLEIRRELHEGALASFRFALLPAIAACGGVIIPALLYIAWNSDPIGSRGWAIPTATDIAFAVGALALLGRRVSAGLRILLLAIAIIDDIIAVLVIALFYSEGIAVEGLLLAGAGILGVFGFQRLGIRHALSYILPGGVVWGGLLMAGIHPSLAGVILGLITPVVPVGNQATLLDKATKAIGDLREQFGDRDQDPKTISRRVQELGFAQREILPPVVRVQIALHPWVAFGIMPLFALANAGISIQGVSIESIAVSPVILGIALGLIMGKPLGIMLGSALLVRLKWCELPAGVSSNGIMVVGCFAGIGFTMSIFISNLAFADASLLATAKLGVLIASTIAALLGLAVGRQVLPLPPK